MGAAALQKYIGSLGGIGTSGVGSSSSYAPKELNKEIIPEKVDNVIHLGVLIIFKTVVAVCIVKMFGLGNVRKVFLLEEEERCSGVISCLISVFFVYIVFLSY